VTWEGIRTSIAAGARRAWAGVRRHPLLWLALPPLLIAAIACAAAAAYVAAMLPLTPSVDDLRKIKTASPSVILTADGVTLATFKRANRERIKLADVSPHVVDALIATEDRRFFEHHGFDVHRTLGAALRTVGGDLQGGSTITQQLARNLYPDDIGRAPTLARKVKEAITAIRIERVYSKEEILETYLNTVPFLYNAYGIEMAARTYFDKSASQLDVLEAATLIGMLKGTRYYNPVLNPERATQRRNIVLAQLVKAGKLDAAQYEALKARPLALNFERQEEDPGPAPHLAQQLRAWLIEWADRKGYNVYADGLVVRTTLDAKLQQMALDAVARQGDKLQVQADAAWKRGKGWAAHKPIADAFVRESQRFQAERGAGLDDADALKKIEADAPFMQALWDEKTRLQAGFLALEPSSGQIKAWVGSRGFDDDKFDHVQQARRQPGSTFKPFVYGAAFDQGISPDETFIDEMPEIRLDDKNVWKPGDVEAASGLPMSLRDGLAKSKNSITSQLAQRIGIEPVARLAYAMGVRQSKLDVVPSLALGTSPVTLREMVSAFGTIANGGSYVEPVLVLSVEDREGKVLERFAPKAPERAMGEAGAKVLLDVMRGVIDYGTGAGVRRFGLQGDLAGKTGTTQANTDGWFILMQPQLVAGAWVGFNDNRVTMTGDAWGQGAHNALLLVGDFFGQAVKARRVDMKLKFAAPRIPPAPPPEPAASMPDPWSNAPAAMQVQTPMPVPPPQPVPVQIQPPPQQWGTQPPQYPPGYPQPQYQQVYPAPQAREAPREWVPVQPREYVPPVYSQPQQPREYAPPQVLHYEPPRQAIVIDPRANEQQPEPSRQAVIIAPQVMGNGPSPGWSNSPPGWTNSPPQVYLPQQQ
jgi:penicillin-binding protein 1A